MKNLDYFLTDVRQSVNSKLIKKYNNDVNENPSLLYDYLKKIGTIFMTPSQNLAYHFAELCLKGVMELKKSSWSYGSSWDGDVPTFYTEKEKWPDDYLKYHDNNPFVYGSSVMACDGNHEIYIRINDEEIDINFIVKDDSDSLYVKRNACFQFTVSTKDNEKNLHEFLYFLKNVIIREYVHAILDKEYEKLVEDFSNVIFEDCLHLRRNLST